MSTKIANRKFLDGDLTKLAQKIAKDYVKGWPSIVTPGVKNDFQNLFFKPKWKIENDGVKYIFNKYAYIKFKNFTPKTLKDLQLGAPIKSNERPGTADTKTLINNSGQSIKRIYTITKGEEYTTLTSDKVGVEVGAEFRAMYRWGNDASVTGGEVEFTASVKSAYEKYQEKSKKTSKQTEDSMEVTVAPKHKMEVTTTQTIADITQTITAIAELDFQIEIHSDHDFLITFDGIEDFNLMVEGLYAENAPGDHTGRLAQWTRNNPKPRLSTDLFETPIVKTVKFQGATAGDLIVDESKI